MSVIRMKQPAGLLGMAIVTLALAGAVRAAERAVTVMATGEVKTKPTTVEIALMASGSAELSADALVKYRASVRRTLDAFTKLKLEQLKITQEELTIGAPNPNNEVYAVASPGEPGAEAVRAQVHISRMLRLRLSGAHELTEDQLIETIVKLMDVAKDSGNAIVGTGTPAMVSFSVDKADALRDEASRAAMSQARTRAAKYAELAGARLGEVQSVEEMESAVDDSSMMWNQYQMQIANGYYSQGTGGSGRLMSPSLGEIPVRVTLRVRFAMLAKETDTK